MSLTARQRRSHGLQSRVIRTGHPHRGHGIAAAITGESRSTDFPADAAPIRTDEPGLT
jgi:hypothetical protein